MGLLGQLGDGEASGLGRQGEHRGDNLDGEEGLLWSQNKGARWTSVGPGLLEGFLALAEQPASAVLDYARRWGVLLVCKHNLPAGHRLTGGPSTRTGGYKSCSLHSRRGGAGYWEPIEVWRDWARRARSVLQLAEQLSDGRLGSPDNWRGISPVPLAMYLPPKTIVEARLSLVSAVQTWLEWGRAQVSIAWTGKSPDVTLGRNRLLGALAIELLFTMTRSRGFALCSSCGRSYAPKRRPRADQRRYCEACTQSRSARARCRPRLPTPPTGEH